jgi:hypothetical protein
VDCAWITADTETTLQFRLCFVVRVGYVRIGHTTRTKNISVRSAHPHGANLFRVVSLAVGLIGPFAIWIGIRAAAKRNIFQPHSMFRVLRVWRWLSWTAAVLLWLACLPPLHLHWFYGGCASTFSLGLSFPEYWLKKQARSTEATATSL